MNKFLTNTTASVKAVNIMYIIIYIYTYVAYINIHSRIKDNLQQQNNEISKPFPVFFFR